MKSLDELLKSLDLPNVTELMLISGKRPATRAGNATDPIAGTDPISGDEILGMLMALGGSRYVEDLGATPKQWTARVMSFGTVSVSALQRGDELQAKLSIAKRDGKPEKKPDPVMTPAPMPRVEPAPTPASAPARQARVEVTSREEPMPGPAPARRAEPAPPPPPAPARFDPPPAPVPKIEAAPLPKIEGAQVQAQPHVGAQPARQAERPSFIPPGTPRAVAQSVHPAPIVNAEEARAGLAMFDTLLATARTLGASDLHIVAGRPPLFRVGGELKPKGAVLDAKAVESAVIPRVPDRLTKMLDEVGSCDFAYQSATHGRFRVNVARHQEGYKACLRVISRELPTIDSLKLPAGIASVTSHHQGLVLFTGPTGHGKTTTLTAVVDLMNRTTTHHIITVEDPVEHIQPKKMALISQREVGTHTRTFASALKGSLREDPDVIVVGELRDVETVRMAIAASETGHLVLGTMNTPSAAKTIDRLIDLFPPADQPQIRLTLAASLRLIVSQRLVPSVDRARVHAALELLPSSSPLSALIRDAKTFQIPSLQQRGKALGIVRLDESLGELVRSMRVSIDDARVFAESQQELDAFVSGARGGA